MVVGVEGERWEAVVGRVGVWVMVEGRVAEVVQGAEWAEVVVAVMEAVAAEVRAAEMEVARVVGEVGGSVAGTVMETAVGRVVERVVARVVVEPVAALVAVEVVGMAVVAAATEEAAVADLVRWWRAHIHTCIPCMETSFVIRQCDADTYLQTRQHVDMLVCGGNKASSRQSVTVPHIC